MPEEQLEFFCLIEQYKHNYRSLMDHLNALHVDQVIVEVDGETYMRLRCTAGGVAVSLGGKGQYRVVVPGGYFYVRELIDRGRLSNGHYRSLVFADFAQLAQEEVGHADT